MRPFALVLMSLLGLAVASEAQEPSGLRKNLKDLEVHGSWVYNDLDRGFAEARKAGKPLLVVFR